MFELAGKGLGKRLIARTFNSQGVPTWGDGLHWAASSILYFLNNKAALGIYQPHRLDSETRSRGDQRYLRSDAGVLEGAKSQFWPYAHFEKIVLDHLRQLDWTTLLRQGPDDESDKFNTQIAQAEMHAASSRPTARPNGRRP